MKQLKSWIGTLVAKSYFLANLVAFELILRVAHLFGRRALNVMSSVQCRLLHWSVPLAFCRLTIEGTEHLDPNRRYVVVVNHQSVMESVFPLSVLAPIRPIFICKKELGRGIPAVSYTLREGGHYLIDRKDREQAVTVRILPPIERAGHTVDEIMQTCEDQLRDTLELLQNPQGTPLPRLSAQA